MTCLRGGGESLNGGANPIYFIDFLKNGMRLKKFWCVRGVRRSPPPFRSATAVDFASGTNWEFQLTTT